MARDLLSQDMVMLSATTTEAPRLFMDTMEVMDMVVIMARDPLSQDIMAVPALLSTRAVLTTMDLMAMVSTTMARGLLMLEVMAMDIHTEPLKVLQAMVVTVMEVMDMVVIMARDLLSQDIMEVPALLSTRAVLTTMDLMAMVSTTM